MKQHFVNFYGSTRITFSGNRNQIIGFDGIDKNSELIEFGETCLNAKNIKGQSFGETGTLHPVKNITIVPFRYGWCTGKQENQIIKHIEDVIEANEKFVQADSIGFPLMMLKSATKPGYDLLGRGNDLLLVKERENEFRNNWCCFGHYYLYIIKIALDNKGYSAIGVKPGEKSGNLINEVFRGRDGKELEIHADAGM